MDKENLKGKALGLLKKKKTMEILIAIIIFAIILSIYASTLGGGSNESEKESEGTSSSGSIDVSQMEEKLENALSAIEGAGKVRVMITYETTPELIPATDSETQTTTNENEENQTSSKSETQSSKTVTIQQQSGTEAVTITEKQPEVRGVIIIAQGADDVRVKMDLLKAAQTVLNVSADRVDVFTMTNQD